MLFAKTGLLVFVLLTNSSGSNETNYDRHIFKLHSKSVIATFMMKLTMVNHVLSIVTEHFWSI